MNHCVSRLFSRRDKGVERASEGRVKALDGWFKLIGGEVNG
jgi:hypothetical protein